MQVDGTRMYRVKAVAEMFDVSESTIRRAIEAGQLVALKIGTGKGLLRIPGAAITAFADALGAVRVSENDAPAEQAGDVA